jgi:hypothetical protein
MMMKIVESWLGPPTLSQPARARKEAIANVRERLIDVCAAWNKAHVASESYALASSSLVLTDAGMTKNWPSVRVS